MRAIRIHQLGGSDNLQCDEIPVPEPASGQVRVKIEAAGVNFIDVYYRTGQLTAALPLTLGSEAAGTVDAVGPDVSDFKMGDRVAYAMVVGAYADYALVPTSKLVHLPSQVESRLAAASMLQGMTAHYLTTDTFPLKAGQTALIHAAAGATGLLLVQVAKLHGARVIGTVSTQKKAQLAREAGADEVILYTQEDFEQAVKRLTGGTGVDVVYDSVGLTTFEKGLNCLRPRGYMVLFGQSSGNAPTIAPQVLNAKGSLFLTRPTLGHYIADRAELMKRSDDLFGWIAAGKLKVRIDKTFPLTAVAEAHRYLEGRQSMGKLLIIP